MEQFPRKSSLFGRILHHISFPVILHLLNSFINSDLLKAISDDDLINTKILGLIVEIVQSVDLGSILLSPFENWDVMDRILSFAFGSVSFSFSGKAFSVLCELSDQFVDSDETDPLFDCVCHFLLTKIVEICEFILTAHRFVEDRVRALDLVCSLLTHVIVLGIGLVEKMFQQSANSSLHICFMSLVSRIIQVLE
jgi:hypothetical protein